ncbi:MAG: ferritin-like domain-containing protein [Myxococcales bacterium]|nr:ferritin-like domain-containing protein [Myxococcales bacterium]
MSRAVPTAASVRAAVTLAVASAVASGCYLGSPSCEDVALTRKLTIADDDYEPLDDGAFRIRGTTYATCREACLADRSTIQVKSCKPPTLLVGRSDAPRTYALTCEVVAVSCELPTIMTFGSGRRPEGLAPVEHVGGAGAPVGAWLARVAHLEAASVPAFERLAVELRAHGAPRDLVAAARRAMRDEIRHARVARSLARRHGGTPQPARVAPRPVRPLDDVALENAIEGCVHETLGAIVATYQAARAGDAALRRAFERIAADETRHAELSWRVLAWTSSRQSDEGRARTFAALVAAADALRPAAVSDASPHVRERVGLPDAATAAHLIAVARAELWQRVGA